jgi:hypothetical protein
MAKGGFVRGGIAQCGGGSGAMRRVGGLDGAKNGGGVAEGGIVWGGMALRQDCGDIMGRLIGEEKRDGEVEGGILLFWRGIYKLAIDKAEGDVL